MNELIKISEFHGQRIVSARELHEFLEVQTRFNDWITNRIKQYEFIKDQDYITFTENSVKPQGGRPTTEYALTIDTAKELSMVENNAKGKQARKYFITIEKTFTSKTFVPAIPQSFAEALELAARQQRSIESQAKQIAILKPKAEFVERSIDSEGLTEMSMAVKVLGLPYGRNIFYKLLRKAGVFFKNRNEPKQQYIEMGFFVVKQKHITRKAHPPIVVNVPFMTQKGMLRMSAWLSERGYFDQKKVTNFIAK